MARKVCIMRGDGGRGKRPPLKAFRGLQSCDGFCPCREDATTYIYILYGLPFFGGYRRTTLCGVYIGIDFSKEKAERLVHYGVRATRRSQFSFFFVFCSLCGRIAVRNSIFKLGSGLSVYFGLSSRSFFLLLRPTREFYIAPTRS